MGITSLKHVQFMLFSIKKSQGLASSVDYKENKREKIALFYEAIN